MEDDWALGIDLFLHNLILTTEARRHGEKPESRSREKTFAIPRRFLLIYSLYICYSKELTGERSVAFPQRETVAFCVLGKFATLCRLGLGLGHPCVTLGRRLSDPWVTRGPRLGRME